MCRYGTTQYCKISVKNIYLITYTIITFDDAGQKIKYILVMSISSSTINQLTFDYPYCLYKNQKP